MTELGLFSPVFIVGMPRSGTTLLRMLLNAHTKIALSPETHFFTEVCDREDVYRSTTAPDEVESSWKNFVRTKYGNDLEFDTETVLSIGENSPDYKTLFQNILLRFAANHHKDICGEKTPEHLFYVPEIVHWFPGARIVHILRDPRDVCLSLKKLHWGSENVFFTAKAWNRFIRFGDQLLQQYPASIMEIRYEDLVNMHEETLTSVCQFIGVPYESGMLNYHQHSDDFIEADEPWKDGVKSPINRSGLGRWKTELPRSEARVISVLTRRFMKRKGYASGDQKGVFLYLNYLINSGIIYASWAVRWTVRFFKSRR